MTLKKPRWNHGLIHGGHVGHASPGDHHGIIAKARCLVGIGPLFCLDSKYAGE